MNKTIKFALLIITICSANSAISDNRTIADALYFINNLPPGISLGAESKPGIISSYENFKIAGNLLTFEHSLSTPEARTHRSLISIQMNETETPFSVGPFSNCKYSENCYDIYISCYKKTACITTRSFRQDGSLRDSTSGTSIESISFMATEKNAIRLKQAFEFIGNKLGSHNAASDPKVKF